VNHCWVLFSQEIMMHRLFLVLLIGAVGSFAVESGNSITFNLTDDNYVLALVKTHATFFIEYPLDDPQAKELHTASFPATSNNVTVTGDQNNDTINMKITFGPVKPTEKSKLAIWEITFTRNKDEGSVSLSKAVLTVPVTSDYGFKKSAVGFGGSYVVEYDVKLIEAVPTGVSYKCKSSESYEGHHEVNKTTFPARLQLTNTQIEAFLDGDDFSEKLKLCPDDAFPSSSSKGTWSVTEHGTMNTTCIMFEADMTLQIKYKIKGHKDLSDWTSFPVPGNKAIVNEKSSCDSNGKGDEQILALEIIPGSGLIVTFHFTNESELGATKNHFNLFQIELAGDLHEYEHHFPNATTGKQEFRNDVSLNGTGVIANFASATVGHSSVCMSSQKKDISDYFKIEVKDLKAQAFTNSGSFLEGEPCAPDQKASDIIPIIVGACLAALVVIVLIAYLIGRARAKRHGYSSV
jgi:hypothetical protein